MVTFSIWKFSLYMLTKRISSGSLLTSDTPTPFIITLNFDSCFNMLASIILAKIEEPFSF